MRTAPGTDTRIREAMQYLELDPAAFARECGVSRQRVNGWINNGAIPKSDALRELYRRRRISPMWIWWGEGEMVLPPFLGPQKRSLVEFVAELSDEESAVCLEFLRKFRGASQSGIEGQGAP